MFRNLAITAVAAGALFTAWTSEANAATCSATVLGAVTATTGTVEGCQFDTTILQDTESSVSGSGLFGIFDWVDQQKFETKDGDDNDIASGTVGDLTIDGNGDDGTGVALDGSSANGGSWAIAGSFFENNDFGLLAFKDGTNAKPATVITYLITGTVTDGANGLYSAMWTDKGIDAVSHISLYGGSCPVTDPDCDFGGGVIPLPAGLPLLLSALGIGGLLRLRQRKAA